MPVSWVWESELNGKSPFKDLVLFGSYTFSSGKDAHAFFCRWAYIWIVQKIRTKHWDWVCKQTITIHLWLFSLLSWPVQDSVFLHQTNVRKQVVWWWHAVQEPKRRSRFEGRRQRRHGHTLQLLCLRTHTSQQTKQAKLKYEDENLTLISRLGRFGKY